MYKKRWFSVLLTDATASALPPLPQIYSSLSLSLLDSPLRPAAARRGSPTQQPRYAASSLVGSPASCTPSPATSSRSGAPPSSSPRSSSPPVSSPGCASTPTLSSRPHPSSRSWSTELDEEAVERKPAAVAGCDGITVQVKDGVFAWDDEVEAGLEVLHRIDIEVRTGALAAVVGMVGSGRSSLLGCVLGEMRKISGKMCL